MKQALSLESLRQKLSVYYPAVALERSFPRKARVILRRVFLFLAVCAFAAIAVEAILGKEQVVFNILVTLFGCLWAMLVLLECFYLSYYFRTASLPFEIAHAVFGAPDEDVMRSMLVGGVGARWGREIFARVGLSEKDLAACLAQRPRAATLSFESSGSEMSAADIARSLLKDDSYLSGFLFSRGITADTFADAADWVFRKSYKHLARKRWWSQERLNRIPSIGADWSYGQTYNLEKYGRFIEAERLYASMGSRWKIYERDLQSIERVLLKHEGANVLIVAPQNESAFRMLAAFGKRIAAGVVPPVLENMRIFVVDGKRIVEDAGAGKEIESVFVSILDDANRIGNIIVAFDNLAAFAESAHSRGVDIVPLLDKYLSSHSLRVIALADSRTYHSTLETYHSLLAHFERVSLHDADDKALESLLQDYVAEIEEVYKIVFTVQSIKAIVANAGRYYGDKSLHDASFDLLHELVPEMVRAGDRIVDAADVAVLSEKKTGIPQAEASAAEKEKLASLEAKLHERVVGQDEAISAISAALRRARTGLSDSKRPLGSFLFIGPTGVGKTETTKALADIFFGGEDEIIRLDMSEYATADAVEKLIGSYTLRESGILSSKLREKPYGVLLLDEFEKTSPKVLDLFLQIIDEGIFTDGKGDKVNARNVIIIATSNAGSDLLYGAAGKASVSKLKVIDEVVARGIFKPELINRFDGVVLFQPLTPKDLFAVGTLALRKFAKRLQEKGIKLHISEALVNGLISAGADPRFGARAISRIIKEQVESAVADRILSGTLKQGMTIDISPDPSAKDRFVVHILDS